MSSKMQRLLVTGGSGFVGRALCERLARHDPSLRITVPTRREMRASSLKALPTVNLVEADLGDDSALPALLARQDALVHLVGILHGDEADFEAAHVELPRRLAAAAAAAGVRRVVHVSALGAAADAPSIYLRSKAAGEQAWRASGLDVTILRPSVIFGANDRLLNLFATLQRWLPLVAIGKPEARFQPVWVGDVAEAIVRCLERPATVGRDFECAGPEVVTLRELVQRAGVWSGHPRPVIGLPDLLADVQATLAGWLPGEPLISHDNLDSMKLASVADDAQPGLAELDITPASLAQVAPGMLAPPSGPQRLDPMRAVARRD